MITQITRFHAENDQSAARLRSVFTGLSSTVPTEPGNRSYTVFEVAETARTFVILESWETSADAERHGNRVVEDGLADVVLPLLDHVLVTENLSPLIPAAQPQQNTKFQEKDERHR